MRISEIADLLTSIGTLLIGIASIITAIKKNLKRKTGHGDSNKVLVVVWGSSPLPLLIVYHI